MKDRRSFIGFILIIISSAIIMLAIAVKAGFVKLFLPLDRAQREIKKLVANGGKVVINWENGSDQEIIYATIDDKRLELSSIKVENEFYTYLINHLEIWGVGEFSLEGKGEIILDGEDLYIIYSSEFKDYSMEYIPDEYENEPGELRNGKKKLF